MNMMITLKKIAVSVVMLALVMPVSATLLTFDNGGTDTSLSTAANWNPDQIPASADNLVIPAGFTATGELGGGAGTQASSVLIQGTVSGGNWALLPMTIDGGSITLGGAGAAFGGAGSANLINNGSMTFLAKTAAEVVSQYANAISVDGVLSVFGSDPLVQEVGDTAYMVENGTPGGDGVTVFIILDPVLGEGQLTSPVEIVDLETTPDYVNVVQAQKARANRLVLLPDSCFFYPTGPRVNNWALDSTTPGSEFNAGNVSTGPISQINKLGQKVVWPIMPASVGHVAVEVYIEAAAAAAGADLIVRIGDSYSNQFTVAQSDGNSPQPWNITAASITAAGVSTSAVQYVELELVHLNGSASAGLVHQIKLTGSPLNNGYLLRARWRPLANHCGYRSSSLINSGRDAVQWIFECKPEFDENGPLSAYAPLTTGFGYYGSVFNPANATPEKNDFDVNGMNFSFWSWGRDASEPPQLEQSHMLSLGMPEGLFGSFTHEGSGVKPEGYSDLFPDPLTNLVLSLRYEPFDLADPYRYKTYASYYYDSAAGDWNFFASSRKYGSSYGAGDNKLNLPGSFVEVPGWITSQRTAQIKRTQDVRGWVKDTAGIWHQCDSITSSDPSSTTPYAKSWDAVGNGWLRMSMGGIIFRQYHVGSITVANAYTGPLPDYMDSGKLDELAREPCRVEVNSVVVHEISGNMLIDFTLTDVDADTEVKLYYGNNDALTLFQEANEWDYEMTLARSFGAGNHQVIIPASDLPGLTPNGYCRILAKCSKGRYWSRETTSSTPVSGNYSPAFSSDPITVAHGVVGVPYVGSLAGHVGDLDGDTVTFSKISGPAWLSVGTTDGTLSGTPASGDFGSNSWIIEVDDGHGGTDRATLNIEVAILEASRELSLNFTAGDSHSDIEATESTGVLGSTGWVNTTAMANMNVDGTAVDVAVSTGFSTLATARNAATADGTDGFLALYDAGIRFADAEQTITISDLSAFLTEEGATEYSVTAYYKSALDGITDPAIFITTAASFTASDAYVTADKSFGASYGFVEAGSGDSNYIIFDKLTADTTTLRFKRDNRDQVLAGIQLKAVALRFAPTFTADPIAGSAATEDEAYAGTLAGSATDANNDPLTYSKEDGPAWLSVATDGILSGTPDNDDLGANAFTVQVADGNGGTDTATLHIEVLADLTGQPVVYEGFDGTAGSNISGTDGGTGWVDNWTGDAGWDFGSAGLVFPGMANTTGLKATMGGQGTTLTRDLLAPVTVGSDEGDAGEIWIAALVDLYATGGIAPGHSVQIQLLNSGSIGYFGKGVNKSIGFDLGGWNEVSGGLGVGNGTAGKWFMVLHLKANGNTTDLNFYAVREDESFDISDLTSFPHTASASYSGKVVINGLGMYRWNNTESFIDEICLSEWYDGIYSLNIDKDADGMPDAWEDQYFPEGTAALPGGNADGDVHSNLEEYIAGMNPTNAGSYFHIEYGAMESGGFVLQWPSVNDRVYRVNWAESLTNTFQLLEDNIELPRNSHTDTLHHAESQGFYKIDVRLK